MSDWQANAVSADNYRLRMGHKKCTTPCLYYIYNNGQVHKMR